LIGSFPRSYTSNSPWILELKGRAVLVPAGSKRHRPGLRAGNFSMKVQESRSYRASRGKPGCGSGAVAEREDDSSPTSRRRGRGTHGAGSQRALGPIDVLVNSAGAAKRYPPDELNAQAWHAAMDAKYSPTSTRWMRCCRRCAAAGVA